MKPNCECASLGMAFNRNRPKTESTEVGIDRSGSGPLVGMGLLWNRCTARNAAWLLRLTGPSARGRWRRRNRRQPHCKPCSLRFTRCNAHGERAVGGGGDSEVSGQQISEGSAMQHQPARCTTVQHIATQHSTWQHSLLVLLPQLSKTVELALALPTDTVLCGFPH